MEMICDGDGDGRVFPVEVDWNFPRHPGDGADSANRELLIYKEFQSDKETVIVTRAKALKNLAVALAILTITTAFLCEWLIRWRFRTNQEVEA